ncbi:gaf domain nucleotide-binding protein [Diaporthe eres]|nr:gaf domain nucleotide-binding protein [Diaporthe eres]
MVHADASTFAKGVSKEEALQQVLDQAAALFDGQRNWVANLANTASLLWHAYKSLPAPSKDVNWAGMFVLRPFPRPSSHHTRGFDVPSLDSPLQRNGRASLPEQCLGPRRRAQAHTPALSNSSLTISNPSIGFYVLDPTSHGKSLILGPFMGQVACQTIDFGRGVCGTAAAAKQTQLVPDVDAFPGHIACDGASRSEIVVPVTVEVVSPEEGGHVEKKVVGIIDMDCAEKNGFDETDKKYLEELAALLGRACDWLDSRLFTDRLLRGAQRGHGQLLTGDEASRPSLRHELGMWAGHVVGQTGYDSMLSV